MQALDRTVQLYYIWHVSSETDMITPLVQSQQALLTRDLAVLRCACSVSNRTSYCTVCSAILLNKFYTFLSCRQSSCRWPGYSWQRFGADLFRSVHGDYQPHSFKACLHSTASASGKSRARVKSENEQRTSQCILTGDATVIVTPCALPTSSTPAGTIWTYRRTWLGSNLMSTIDWEYEFKKC